MWRGQVAFSLFAQRRREATLSSFRCVNAEKLLVKQDPSVYFFISQGSLTVENVNDQEEMDMVEVCTAAISVCMLVC